MENSNTTVSTLANELNKLFSLNESILLGNRKATHQEIAEMNLDRLERIAELIDIRLDNKAYHISDCESARSNSERNKKISKRLSREVAQYDLDGNLINIFYGTNEAERQTGVHQTNISKCCRGKLNKAGGSIWRYTND